MKFSQLEPLIIHNMARSFASNGLSLDYFDPQELDSTLSHGENLEIALTRRGIRTREEFRAQLRYYREYAAEYTQDLYSED